MKVSVSSFKAPLCKTLAHLRLLGLSLSASALFAAIAAPQVRAEDTVSPLTARVIGFAAPVTDLSGVRSEATVLPSGAIRRRVWRPQAPRSNVQPLADQVALADHMLKMPLQPNVLAMRRQAVVGGNPLSVDLRLGASVSPHVNFVAGIDARIPVLSIGPGFTTRADLDAIFSLNTGGVKTLFPLTIDELFHADLPGGSGLYAGVGVGPMLGDRTRFGGKIIVGASITSRFRLEGNVLFTGFGDSLFNVLLRIPVL